MRTITLALLLMGCGVFHHNPRVPQSQLSAVPPTVVDQTKSMQVHEAELDRQIAQARVTLDDADKQVANEEQRIKSNRAAEASDLDIKQLAVERGDASAAQIADQRKADRDARLAEANRDLDAAKVHRDRSSANLELLQSERELVDAQLQLARARGVASQTDFNTDKYEAAVRDAQKRRDEAAQRLQSLPPEPQSAPQVPIR